MSGVKGTKARRVQLPVPFLVILILCASLLKRDLPSAILVVNSSFLRYLLPFPGPRLLDLLYSVDGSRYGPRP